MPKSGHGALNSFFFLTGRKSRVLQTLVPTLSFQTSAKVGSWSFEQSFCGHEGRRAHRHTGTQARTQALSGHTAGTQRAHSGYSAGTQRALSGSTGTHPQALGGHSAGPQRVHSGSTAGPQRALSAGPQARRFRGAVARQHRASRTSSRTASPRSHLWTGAGSAAQRRAQRLGGGGSGSAAAGSTAQ